MSPGAVRAWWPSAPRTPSLSSARRWVDYSMSSLLSSFSFSTAFFRFSFVRSPLLWLCCRLLRYWLRFLGTRPSLTVLSGFLLAKMLSKVSPFFFSLYYDVLKYHKDKLSLFLCVHDKKRWAIHMASNFFVCNWAIINYLEEIFKLFTWLPDKLTCLDIYLLLFFLIVLEFRFFTEFSDEIFQLVGPALWRHHILFMISKFSFSCDIFNF